MSSNIHVFEEKILNNCKLRNKHWLNEMQDYKTSSKKLNSKPSSPNKPYLILMCIPYYVHNAKI